MSDTLDILSLAEAKATLGILTSDTSRDTILAAYITAVSRRIDELVGPVVIRTITSEAHDGGGSVVYPKWYPVSSVTTMTEYQGTAATSLTSESVSSKPADGFIVTGYFDHKIIRRSGNVDGCYPVGRENVVVTYTAGRYATTATVDERFKTAARLTLKNAWRAEELSTVELDEFSVPRQTFPAFAVPRVVVELLQDEVHDVRVVGTVI